MKKINQSGLLYRWKQVYWALQFRHIKIQVNQDNQSTQTNLKFNQVSLAFYVLFCYLPFSIAILFIEPFYFMFNYKNNIIIDLIL